MKYALSSRPSTSSQRRIGADDHKGGGIGCSRSGFPSTADDGSVIEWVGTISDIEEPVSSGNESLHRGNELARQKREWN